MAVTVVQNQKTNQTECYRCKSVLQYVYTDIKHKITSDYTGGRESVNYIECPVCGHHAGVSGSIN